MNGTNPYVREDKEGVWRVGAGRAMLDSVVAAFEQGRSAETIRQQYPSLTLEEVYGSLAYYLRHIDEAQAYLRRQEKVWEEERARAEQRPGPVVERLRAMRRGRAAKAS